MTSFAQNANLLKPAPALPSSSGVSKFDDIPVDLHTGIANVSIPLININISGFSMPVSINYHGGGVKTEDIASNAGLGWALVAGGQINKLVVKYPDEGMKPAVADSIQTIEDGFGNRLKRNPSNTKNWKYENDIADVFRASGPNLSCRFSELTVHSPKELIKVQHPADGSFLLTNTDGTKYRFGGKANPSTNKSAIEDSSVYHLTEIELANGQKINFIYEAIRLNTGKSFGREFHYINRDTTKLNDLIDDGLSAIFDQINADTTFRISVITYPGGKIEFVYGAARKDLPGASVLAGIRQYDLIGSTLMRLTKEVNLYQSYFECSTFDVRLNASADPRFKSLYYRLRLDSVAINGTLHPDTYTFEYNNTEMPEQGSLSQDHWGYYNGSPNQSLVAPYKMVRQRGTLWEHTVYSSYSNRVCNDSLAQAGILKKITYPNGGSASFEYELNTTSVQFPGYVSYPNAADDHQAKRQKLFPLTAGLNTTHQNELLTGCNFVVNSATAIGGVKGETVTFNFRKIGNGNVYIQLRISPLAAGTTTSTAALFDTVLNIPAGQINLTAIYSRFLPNGLYRVTTQKVPFPNGWETLGADVLLPVALTFSSGTSIMSQALTSGAPGRYAAGGLRIKRMSIFDGSDHSKDIIKQFKYHKFGDTTTSSGSLGQLPEYREEQATLHVPVLAFQAVVGSKNELYTFSEAFWDIYSVLDPDGTTWHETEFLNTQFKQYEIETPAYLGAFDYDQADFNVKMAMSNKTAIRPVESYVGYSNVTVEYGTNAAGGKTELTYHNIGADWQRPLPVKEKSFRKTGSAFFPVTEKSNTFTVNADWYYLQSQVSKEYAQDDTTQTLQTRMFHSYAFPYLSIPTRTVLLNSMGDSTVSESILVAGFSAITLTDNISLGIKNLYSKNMLALPVETTSYTKSTTGRGNLVSSFTAYATDKPYPETIFTTGAVSSATTFTNAAVTGGAVVKSSLHKPEMKFVKYDAAGNLLEQQKQTGISYAYTWCHNNRYLAAEATNVKSGQFFYTSFEEGDGLFDMNSKAGAQCFNGNYTATFSPSPMPAAPMKIGYWSRTGAVWTYFNLNYTPGMVLTGDKIDEVRIYPADAQMATYTWQPGIGMSSKCDANNRYLFYEYNAEGKLIAVRNENRDLIQTIQYQPEVN